ncbi:MAG: four helix bundle protein [Marinilabiliales bacterium]|nr:MAG: four helix bundle protein [Marinilabiliales bacterium]
MENIEKKYNFFRFEDLRIYRKALDYSKWVSDQTNTFEEAIPGNHFRQNFVKASLEIAMNIAEGSGRNKSQFIYYLKMAKSSIRECVVLTTVALDHGFFSQETHDESREFLIEISKMVGALISSLQRNRRNDSHDESDDDNDNSMSYGDDYNTD